MEIKINNAYAVSEQTAKLVHCCIMANKLYAEVADTLEEMYGGVQTDIVLEQFSIKFIDAQKELELLLLDNIRENLGTLGNDSIL